MPMTPTTQTRRADDVLEAVAQQRRRRTLRELADAGGSRLSTAELADRVVTRNDIGSTKEAEVTLRHTVLPKLDESGLVTFDPSSGLVYEEIDGDVRELLAFVERRFE